jgi:single-stranded DNA-binding protein
MESFVRIQGYVHSEFKEITLKNGYSFIHFKLRVLRDSKRNINNYQEDHFNCMISNTLEYNPEKNLSKGNIVRIEGYLQNNKTIINNTSIDVTYIVVNHLTVEKNVLLTHTKQNTKQNVKQNIKPKIRGVYNKNQPYSSSKPYHDNFPKEYDTRGKITCQCGNTFLDTLESCPSCGRSIMEILRDN